MSFLLDLPFPSFSWVERSAFIFFHKGYRLGLFNNHSFTGRIEPLGRKCLHFYFVLLRFVKHSCFFVLESYSTIIISKGQTQKPFHSSPFSFLSLHSQIVRDLQTREPLRGSTQHKYHSRQRTKGCGKTGQVRTIDMVVEKFHHPVLSLYINLINLNFKTTW